MPGGCKGLGPGAGKWTGPLSRVFYLKSGFEEGGNDVDQILDD